MKNSPHRIVILDSFRALAILSVLLFHFFSRYTTPYYKVNLYPYGNTYDYFRWGYLGVEFFFIISGFVIYFTLDSTKNFCEFWIKRLIRLWPSIFFASILIFVFFTVFDRHSAGGQLKNFIPSLFFIKPVLINNILKLFGIYPELSYLNGSFWSLWVEIQFYFCSSLLFFINRKKFLFNILLLTLILTCANLILHNIQGSNLLGFSNSGQLSQFYKTWFDDGFNLLNYLPFFTIGVILFHLFKNRTQGTENSAWVFFVLFLLITFIIYFGKDFTEKIAYTGMLFMFFTFIYFPDKLKFLEIRPLTKIGESSYFLYLIHENVGVFIIVNLGTYFLPVGFLLPLILILFFIYFSLIYTYNVDKKINKWLKSRWLKMPN